MPTPIHGEAVVQIFQSLDGSAHITSITPICTDANVPGRVWATQGSSIGYTDDHGETFTAKTAQPAATIVQAKITTNFMWLLISAQTSKNGSLWRSPKPDANGNGLNFVKQFDLTGMVNGLGGAAADIA